MTTTNNTPEESKTNEPGILIDPDKIYTTEELAKLFNVEIVTVLRWRTSGKFKGSKMGKHYYYKGSDVLKMWNSDQEPKKKSKR